MKCHHCHEDRPEGIDMSFEDHEQGVSFGYQFCSRGCFLVWAKTHMTPESFRRVFEALENEP